MKKRKEVLKFADVMEQKLRENDHKSHWSGLGRKPLLDMLADEMLEMETSILDNLPPEVIERECADIANFAMMIADNIKNERWDKWGKIKK